MVHFNFFFLGTYIALAHFTTLCAHHLFDELTTNNLMRFDNTQKQAILMHATLVITKLEMVNYKL